MSRKFCFLLYVFCMTPCFANLSGIYIQKGDQVNNLSGFIGKHQGTTAWTGEGKQYRVDVQGKSVIMDISSDASVSASMAELFPNQIFIKFMFSGVAPVADIFIEDNAYGRTDKNGDFKQGKFFDTEPKQHHIKLVQNNTVVSEVDLDIDKQINVECAGQSPMKCHQ